MTSDCSRCLSLRRRLLDHESDRLKSNRHNSESIKELNDQISLFSEENIKLRIKVFGLRNLILDYVPDIVHDEDPEVKKLIAEI